MWATIWANAQPEQPAGPVPLAGKAPLTLADLQTIGRDEAVERMDEIEALKRLEQGR